MDKHTNKWSTKYYKQQHEYDIYISKVNQYLNFLIKSSDENQTFISSINNSNRPTYQYYTPLEINRSCDGEQNSLLKRKNSFNIENNKEFVFKRPKSL